MATETPVILGTGQKLRNLAVTVIDPATGLPATVLMEVVSISDANGNVISEFMDYKFNLEVMRRLTAIVNQLILITNTHVPVDSLLEGE